MEKMTKEQRLAVCNELHKFFGFDKYYNWYNARIEVEMKYKDVVESIIKKNGGEITQISYKYNYLLNPDFEKDGKKYLVVYSCVIANY